MSSPIAAYQLRPFDPALADGPIAQLIAGDYQAWKTFTAYPLNSDMMVCGPFAVVAVNERKRSGHIQWRGELHVFDTASPNDALRSFWNVPEYRPRPKPKPVQNAAG